MTTALDTTVLIDLFQQEPEWASRAAASVDRAISLGRIIACDVVWAEVAGRFPSEATLAEAMTELGVEYSGIGELAAGRAGQLWRRFRNEGGARRDRIVPDFLIGAHALDQADALLTRDRGFYRKYFRGLRIIEP